MTTDMADGGCMKPLARRDRRRRHGRAPVSGDRGRARAAARASPDAIVTFAGTARGIEARVVPREGFELDLIRSAGLKGKSLGGAAARRAAAAARARSTRGASCRAAAPHLVIGVGGYSSGPVVLLGGAARHPDAAARAERGARADQPAARAVRQRGGGDVRVDAAVLRGKGFVTGNPVRPEFLGESPAHRADRAAGRRGS